MIVAPLLDPPGEAPEAIQVDAGGLIKEVLDVGHKVQWTGLLELQGFLLVLEEVVKEPLLDPGPVRLCKVVDTVLIVDLEDMLEVLPPSTEHFKSLLPAMWDHGGRTLSDLSAEAGLFQVLAAGVWH